MTVSAFKTVEIERSGAVVTLWLNRPEVRNAFDQTMIAELTQAFALLGTEADLRVVVLAARGASFCAGGDLNWMRASAAFTPEENQADARNLALMLRAVHACPKPVIARVQGDAFGGGVGLVCAADIAIAAREARFALSEVRIGLVPATIGPYVLQAIGKRASSRYMLTGNRMAAIDAERIGIVHEVVPAEGLDAAVQATVGSLLACSPAAIRETKRLIQEIHGRAFDDELIADTAARIAAARASSEGREGIQAFLEKRKPAWTR